MQPDGGILEEVGKLLLASPEFFFGGLALDELAEVAGDRPHQLQEVDIGLPDSPGEELDHAEGPVGDDDGAGESAVKAVTDGRGEAGEIRILCDVEYPGRLAARPHPPRQPFSL